MASQEFDQLPKVTQMPEVVQDPDLSNLASKYVLLSSAILQKYYFTCATIIHMYSRYTGIESSAHSVVYFKMLNLSDNLRINSLKQNNWPFSKFFT